MEREAARRIFDEQHGEGTGRRFHDGTRTYWTEERTTRTPYAYDDGAEVWVSVHNLSPDDDFLHMSEGEEPDGTAP